MSSIGDAPVVRVPASSANIGAGFDVLGLALDLHLDVGAGHPPDGADLLDRHHPAIKAFTVAGGSGPIWMRSSIPMGRGLGFSGAARVAGAALAIVQGATDPDRSLLDARARIAAIAADLEGHGDNAAASAFGGVVAWVDGRAIPLRVGPALGAAAIVIWIPDATTSTDRSRAGLSADVSRVDTVHNLGRTAQFVLAVEHDDPALLAGATDDRIHESARLDAVPGGAEALEGGVAAGAWCGWLSGSGPTIALFCDAGAVGDVIASLPLSGHTKTLRIARRGAHAPSSHGAWAERGEIGDAVADREGPRT